MSTEKENIKVHKKKTRNKIAKPYFVFSLLSNIFNLEFLPNFAMNLRRMCSFRRFRGGSISKQSWRAFKSLSWSKELFSINVWQISGARIDTCGISCEFSIGSSSNKSASSKKSSPRQKYLEIATKTSFSKPSYCGKPGNSNNQFFFTVFVNKEFFSHAPLWSN